MGKIEVEIFKIGGGISLDAPRDRQGLREVAGNQDNLPAPIFAGDSKDAVPAGRVTALDVRDDVLVATLEDLSPGFVKALGNRVVGGRRPWFTKDSSGRWSLERLNFVRGPDWTRGLAPHEMEFVTGITTRRQISDLAAKVDAEQRRIDINRERPARRGVTSFGEDGEVVRFAS